MTVKLMRNDPPRSEVEQPPQEDPPYDGGDHIQTPEILMEEQRKKREAHMVLVSRMIKNFLTTESPSWGDTMTSGTMRYVLDPPIEEE